MSLNERKLELEKSKWENWLYATISIDILEPIKEVMQANHIPPSDMEAWGEEGFKRFIDNIPTRKLDIHLHKQVIKNEQYKPKKSDLEDWAGLGAASCYSDVVVCEKHFANLVKRDSFQTKARVETKLSNIIQPIIKPI